MFSCVQGCGSGSAWIHINLSCLDPDPDPGGQKLPTNTVLRIRDVYPGSRIRLFFIPDPGSELSPSRIPDPGSSSKNLSILTQKKTKKWFLSCKKYDPGCSSRIPDPDAGFLPIPDSGSRIQGSKRHPIPDPGSGSAILHKYRKRLRIFIF
jgi:hypothetical protein